MKKYILLIYSPSLLVCLFVCDNKKHLKQTYSSNIKTELRYKIFFLQMDLFKN